jgi:hypothetical protein
MQTSYLRLELSNSIGDPPCPQRRFLTGMNETGKAMGNILSKLGGSPPIWDRKL